MVFTRPWHPSAMMAVPVELVTDICRRVAAEHSPSVEVLGVASSKGGTGRVEVLLTLTLCDDERCRISLNLSRANQAALESELRFQLGEVLRSHAAPMGS